MSHKFTCPSCQERVTQFELYDGQVLRSMCCNAPVMDVEALVTDAVSAGISEGRQDERMYGREELSPNQGPDASAIAVDVLKAHEAAMLELEVREDRAAQQEMGVEAAAQGIPVGRGPRR